MSKIKIYEAGEPIEQNSERPGRGASTGEAGSGGR